MQLSGTDPPESIWKLDSEKTVPDAVPARKTTSTSLMGDRARRFGIVVSLTRSSRSQPRRRRYPQRLAGCCF